jgi:hypothetical protein
MLSMLLNAFRSLFSNSQKRKAERASGLPRPELLRFEDRITPSNSPIFVSTTADSGAGSLRLAVDYANAIPGNNQVNFRITATIMQIRGF